LFQSLVNVTIAIGEDQVANFYLVNWFCDKNEPILYVSNVSNILQN